MGKAAIVAKGLPLWSLVLFAEMGPAGFLPGQGIAQHQLGQGEEIGHPQGLLQFAIGPRGLPWHPYLLVEARLEEGHLLQTRMQTPGAAANTAVLNHQMAQLPVEGIHGLAAARSEQGVQAPLGPGFGFAAGGMVGCNLWGGVARQPGGHRGRCNEITIG